MKLINDVLRADTNEQLEREIDELLNSVEDMLIMAYIRGRNNGLAKLRETLK